MIIDALDFVNEQVLKADICVIGAGAAGIAFAREFAKTGYQVVVLEGGGETPELETQSLYKGEVVGRDYDPLDACRVRCLGGSTNHWGGFTRPLDDVDFRKREWIDNSGWPISKEDLVSYYRKAQEVVQVGQAYYDQPEEYAENTDDNHLIDAGDIQTRLFKISPPTRFGTVYREELENANNIQLILHANLVDFGFYSNGSALKSAYFQGLNGKRHEIQADSFVLATGGIENARILLNCRSVHEYGIGNQNDLIGRYFCDHDGVISGSLILTDDFVSNRFYQPHELKGEKGGGVRVLPTLTLSEELQLKRRLPNANVYFLPAESNAVLGSDSASKLAPDMQSLLRFWETSRTPDKRRLYRMVMVFENTPNPASRVRLSERKDAIGMQQSVLNWQYHANDKGLLERLCYEFSRQISMAGLARVHIDPRYLWPIKGVEVGRHHMGTTRMHDDPRHGAVDKNSKVHGTDNLYVLGSSVFPTFGYAQPTLTIVALALRLAEHLQSKGGGR